MLSLTITLTSPRHSDNSTDDFQRSSPDLVSPLWSPSDLWRWSAVAAGAGSSQEAQNKLRLAQPPQLPRPSPLAGATHIQGQSCPSQCLELQSVSYPNVVARLRPSQNLRTWGLPWFAICFIAGVELTASSRLSMRSALSCPQPSGLHSAHLSELVLQYQVI